MPMCPKCLETLIVFARTSPGRFQSLPMVGVNVFLFVQFVPHITMLGSGSYGAARTRALAWFARSGSGNSPPLGVMKAVPGVSQLRALC